MPQDMPPAGGYRPVQYRRNLPARGFRPSTWLLIMGGVTTFGLYKYAQGVAEMKYVVH
jgi:NADH dehydrogenase (ubiquinone) 1 alpha subcomplex subunit 13